MHYPHKPECIVTTNPDRSVLIVIIVVVATMSMMWDIWQLLLGYCTPCCHHEMIYILCLIIIIKSEVWTITYCLGLGHETMVCAVCLSIFLYTCNCMPCITINVCLQHRVSHNIMTIITWHFQFRLINASILHLKYEYGAWNEGHFMCYSHCYITWWYLMTGIVASQCP